MATREIKLLWGYLPNVDYPYAAARRQKLNERLTILLMAQQRYNVDYYYDSELALRLLQAVCQTIDHSAMALLINAGRGTETFHSVSELSRFYLAQPPCAREPVARGRLIRGDATVCLITASDCTGPNATEAYAGNYCITFYLQDYDREAISRQCRAVCAELGARLTEEIQGHPRPRVSLWTRLYNFIDSSVEDDESI